jgi:predicted phosphodiesterase
MSPRKSLVLSDIHANAEALRAVVRDAFTTFRPEIVVVAGDIIGYGPDPRHVIRTLRRGLPLLGSRLVAVDGNHDREARDKEMPCEMHGEAARCLQLNRDELDSGDVMFLRSLADRAWVGDFTVMHDPLEMYVEYPHEARVVLEDVSTPHAIVGHTHLPGYFEATVVDGAQTLEVSDFIQLLDGAELIFEAGKRYVLNPGSVGQPRNGDPRAAYLEITEHADGTTVVQAHRVAYDVAATQAKMRDRGYPKRMADRLEMGW